MKTDQRRWMLLAALVVVVAIPLLAQFGGRRFRSYPPGMGWAEESVRAEMFFTRLAYSDGGGGRRGWGGGSWRTDWPDAEYHLMNGVKRLTMIDAAHGGRFAQPSDDELFEYPWIYAVEVGNWYLDDEDAARMREYLLRGGFLMVDDFHGGYEWTSFTDSMRRVFPDRPIIEIPEEDPVLHVLYDLDQRIQIPGIAAASRGITYERADGRVPFWRGIYDDEQRLMVAINFNMDLGDAWEHADDPRYPEPMTALAYRFGINYIVYAMTH